MCCDLRLLISSPKDDFTRCQLHYPLKGNEDIWKIAREVKTVAEGVFNGMLPHAIDITAQILLSTLNFRILSVVGIGLSLVALTKNYENCNSPMETLCLVVQTFAVAASIADLALSFFPPYLTLRLSIDVVLIVASMVGSCRFFLSGMSEVVKASNGSQLETSKRIAHFITGALSISLASHDLITTSLHGLNFMRGVTRLNKLDPLQREFVIKHKAIHTLGQAHSQKAVIIDGLSSKWGKKADNAPSPVSQFIYENADTRTYSVSSSAELRHVLKQATLELGGPIDLLAFEGHANNQFQVLGPNYYFYGNAEETRTLQKYLARDAQVFLLGCNTATMTDHYPSLSEHIAEQLPGRSVTGYAAYLNPFVMLLSLKDKKFNFGAFCPISLGDNNQWRWVGFSNTNVIFQN